MRAARLVSWIAACVLPLGVSAAAEAPLETPSEIFERGLAHVQERYPGLITIEPLSDGIALTDIDVEKREVLYGRVSAGDWSEELSKAFRVIFAGMSMQAGTVAVEGRETLQVVSGLAAESGDLETILGVTALLTEIMNDAAHNYSILAQDLLSEKMRCGAASIGDDELVAAIAESVDPDRAYQFAGTDGTIGDRYGLHGAADLFSVAARGEVVVAVGYFGSVLVSHDSGETFATPDTGTDEALFAVATGGPGEWWAAGRGGIVLYSSDDGYSWQRRDTPFQRHYFGVHGGSVAGDALIVGDFGLQLATRDAGKSWTCLPREQDVILGRIVPAGADALLVGEFGTLERFSNNRPPGTQGRTEGVPDDFYVFDAWFDADGQIGVAVGLGGAVLRTEDRGATWSRRQTPFDADLYAVAGSGKQVLAVGEGGLIAISEDGGESFREAAGEAPPVPIHDAIFDESGGAYLVGPRGSIFRFDVANESVTRIHPKAGP